VYPDVELTCCFFHLGQSVYRQVQALGLQRAYNDPDDETVRVYNHTMLALAYVPEAEVGQLFQLLSDDAPDCMTPLFKYFDRYYVTGVPARGRRRAVQP